MRISKETLEALQAQGIKVRWYPEETFKEHWDNCYEQQRKGYIDYYKDTVGDRLGDLFKTMADLEKRAEEHAEMTTNSKALNRYDAPVLYVSYGDRTFAKKENVKSKEITVEYVQKLVERDKKAFSGAYGDFARKMEQLLKSHGIGRNFCIYPTTYGIGVWLFCNFSADADIKRVDSILNEQGIEFRNEYSEAQWVWRYVISKAEANRLRIDKAA